MQMLRQIDCFFADSDFLMRKRNQKHGLHKWWALNGRREIKQEDESQQRLVVRPLKFIHVCESTALFCWRHARTAICCPSKVRQAWHDSSHTHHHRPACGRTASWGHTRWPVIETDTRWDAPAEKSFFLSLFLDAQVGPIIARLCVCLSFCLSFCLLPSAPFGPRLRLGLRTQKIFPCKTPE